MFNAQDKPHICILLRSPTAKRDWQAGLKDIAFNGEAVEIAPDAAP